MGAITEVIIPTFSDASFNQISSSGYGQNGGLTGLFIVKQDIVDSFHWLEWWRNKQRRVRYAPYGAEVLACADEEDRVFYFKYDLRAIFSTTIVDSLCM